MYYALKKVAAYLIIYIIQVLGTRHFNHRNQTRFSVYFNNVFWLKMESKPFHRNTYWWSVVLIIIQKQQDIDSNTEYNNNKNNIVCNVKIPISGEFPIKKQHYFLFQKT